MMSSFAGKVVIVTGGSSGIGAATALAFARLGASVVVAARRRERGEAIVAQIEKLGTPGLFVQTDVTKTADVESLVGQTLTAYGRLDCAVNNAGIAGPVMTPVAAVEESAWDELMNTNLRAVWLCMKYEIRAMQIGGGPGSIVNVSSIYGYKPSDLGHAPYSASKHAVIGLSQSAAIDYAQQGIRINVVAPGFTITEMVDPTNENLAPLLRTVSAKYSAMNRLGAAEETAAAITWLCSDAASFVNGVVIPVTGGDTTRLY